MKSIQVAFYARVSSDQQSEAKTIESQVADLRARIASTGVTLCAELEFIDNGCSGAILIRPALERLRDVAAAGGIDQLYVHCPDRLARNYAHQVLLLEEFLRAGVEVIFLNREVGQTPEDHLLLQVQGMISEYERAKIMERSRRGKRHGAQVGKVSVLSGAPYGYRYVSKQEGDGEARYEVVWEEARVVRQVFEWVGRDRCSIGEVSRRLQAAGERTRMGKTVWDRGTIHDMLKNPAYKGEAAFGKTAIEPLRPRLRAQRGRPLQPKRPYSSHDVPTEQWMSIAVPALVDADLFESVAEQLQENRAHARVGQRGARYLLQGLISCACCGYAYYGKQISPSARKHHERTYAYYRCIGTDAYRFGGVRICSNKQLRTDLVDEAVWEEVCRLLQHPEQLEQEYRRRFLQEEQTPDELSQLEARSSRLRQGVTRLIDSYAEGLINKDEFEPRVTRMRERLKQIEEQALQIKDDASLERELTLILGRLDEFASRVKLGLEQADWSTRRDIIRALVKRVEIDQERVRVIFRVNPPPVAPQLPSEKNAQSLQHCGGRVYTYFGMFRDDGTWQRIHDTLRTQVRERAGRHKHPTAGALDSQSVKTTPVPGVRGYDAGKKVKGRKRHILVDTLGLLLVVVVTSAAVSDPAGARLLLKHLPGACKKLRRIWVDGAYRGQLLEWVLLHCKFVLQPALRSEGQKGFVVLPRRWVVERTFAWITQCRRLGKDYEVLPQSSQAMIYIAMTRLMVRRLAAA